MTVLVLGAGVVGVTTAYYLAKAGHQVTVIDRREGPALETSFANGGQISACHTEPWASPGNLPKILKWLGRDDAPLKFRLKADPALWSWSLRFLSNSRTERARTNAERMLRIALYSRDCLRELRQETQIQYDQRQEGILHVYQDARELAAAVERNKRMTAQGLKRDVLDAQGCVTIEPALGEAVEKGLVRGGLYTPEDESGDAHAFTVALSEQSRDLGVDFQFNTPVTRLLVENGTLRGVETTKGAIEGDACVVALGSYSPFLVKPLGLKLPIYPAKGYSVTLPVAPDAKAPTVSLIQDELKLVYSRLGDRLRVAGTAEIAGYNDDVDEKRARFIQDAARTLFPHAAGPSDGEFWAGLRPKTPDSVPVLGQTPIAGLFLNTGHGTLGWTMACGSAHVLSQVISGHPPAISLDGLEINRF